MNEWHDIPSMKNRRDRTVEVVRREGLIPFVREHYTDTRNGCYIIEDIFIEGLE